MARQSPITSPGCWIARRWLPEGRNKIAAAARGRVLSPAHNAKRFAGIHKGWRDRVKARHAACRRTGRFPNTTKSDPWIPEEEKLLRTVPTAEPVRTLGRTARSIQVRRIVLDIRAHPLANQQPWRQREIRLHGTAPDAEIAT